MKLGDRVAEMGSWYVGTITHDWGESCLIEYDAHGRYLTGDRTEYKFKHRLQIAQPFQEWYNAVGMRKCGVATCFPKLPIEWRDR